MHNVLKHGDGGFRPDAVAIAHRTCAGEIGERGRLFRDVVDDL